MLAFRTIGSGGAGGGLLRFPLPGPSAEGTPGSAAQKTRRRPSAIVLGAMQFEDVVREFQDDVYGAAIRILGDRDAALDVANVTFMKAYRSFGSYDPSRPLRHWLLRIAVNEAISAGRARTRALKRHAPADAALAVADPAPAPDRVAADREAASRIRAAVAALPELYRTVVVLRYFNELSVEEVAAVTGRSASTVGVQLLRARGLLRNALGSADV